MFSIRDFEDGPYDIRRALKKPKPCRFQADAPKLLWILQRSVKSAFFSASQKVKSSLMRESARNLLSSILILTALLVPADAHAEDSRFDY